MPDLDSIKAQIAKVKQTISRLIDGYAEGLLDKDEFTLRIRRAKERLGRLIVGSAIVGACILAFLGYTIYRDRAAAETARREQQQQFIDEQKAEYDRLRDRLHDLRLQLIS
jgi:hypothetical protein